MVKFLPFPRNDIKTLKFIVNRAVDIFKKNGVIYHRMDCHMDIVACHLNGNPLKLKALLEADDFNFVHDIAGIRQHLNRETGELMHCFRPRFSA